MKTGRSQGSSLPRFYLTLFLAGLVLTLTAHPARADERGAQLFVQCKSCHAIATDAPQPYGPSLHSLFGKPAAATNSYRYSESLRAAADRGLIWNRQSLDELLRDPQRYIPGIDIPLKGFADPQDRKALIDYLAMVYSPDGPGIEISDDPAAPERLLGLSGDPAYGEYLASECLACHQTDGSDDGIPSIVGWSRHRFERVMHAYRVKARSNAVMQTVGGSLGDEEIAALARYFEELGKQQ